MSDPVLEFRDILECAGLVPGEIIADGYLHRCGTIGKERGKDGAYVFHPDPPVSGWWQNFRTGQEDTWAERSNLKHTPEERRKLDARIKSDKSNHKEEEILRYANARKKAERIVHSCPPATAAHPYLTRKGIASVEGLLLARNGRLVVPVYDDTGAIMSLQFISNDGQKRFLTNGKTKGGYFPFKGEDGPLYIAEGIATAATIHAVTGKTVLAAFNAGNLEAVATMARAKYPEREIIICADDDRDEKGNPGLTKATKAAQQIGGLLSVPRFANPDSGTDFNDLASAEGLVIAQEQLSMAQPPEPKAQTNALPMGFEERKSGIYFLAENKDGDIIPEWICSPLRVLALTRDADGQEWGRLLEVVDPDGTVHKWALPMSMLSGNGDAYRAHILSLGLRLAHGSKAKNRLEMFLSLARPETRARCVSRIGWHGGRFVLPDTVIGQHQGEEIILQGASGDNPFRISGSLDDWQREIGEYCAGNSRLVLAVSTALAAPLLSLTDSESGGFHFVAGSSQGKTTALAVAGSICGGGGLNGYTRQWRITSNGLEAVAASHCDALLCLDELSQVTPREAGEVVYMVANGTGKSRANRNGDGRKPAEWRILFLSTGEISLADKVCEDGKGRATAGQAVRVVDIPADPGAGLGLFETLHDFPDGGHFSRHLKEASRRFYGAPLRSFLEHVSAHIDDVTASISKAIQRFTAANCPQGADGQVRRVLGRFALAAAAGDLGASIGILPWPKGEAESAALNCFQAWLTERGGMGAAETQIAISQVRAFIEAHGTSRFEDLDGGENQRIFNRVGFRQKVEGQIRFCFFPEAFKQEVCAGLNVKNVCRALTEQGMLVSEAGRFTLTVRTPEGRTKFYVIASAILLGDVGDSGDNREETNNNLSPLPIMKTVTSGTGIGDKSERPQCPQPPNSTRGQQNAPDWRHVPAVPVVPTQNAQGHVGNALTEVGS